MNKTPQEQEVEMLAIIAEMISTRLQVIHGGYRGFLIITCTPGQESRVNYLSNIEFKMVPHILRDLANGMESEGTVINLDPSNVRRH